MAFWKILTIICAVSVHAESRSRPHKREVVVSICDPVQNSTDKVHCYCGRLTNHLDQIGTAECYLTNKNITNGDPSWDEFKMLQNISKLTLTNTRGIAMNFIPTNALTYTKAILRLDVKYCNIEKIEPLAFANLSLIEDLTLRDNQIKVLSPYAFAYHARVKTISLDQNNIAEVNRNVFVDLPSLEQLFLTGNKIATIHDKAFVHLTNLKELEIDKNNIFSLNSDTFSGLTNLEKLELSGNSLEVIGDNTFAPLTNLHLLNLADNKIQMLDEKAFNGLTRLQILSLENNKLSKLENTKIFEGFHSLTSLNLKNNEITAIRPEVILPIMSNFYGKTSQLNLDGNKLKCDCDLDVFRPIMNRTQNVRLSTDIQNLQCFPNEEVKQKWERIQETAKNTDQVFEDVEPQGENANYEYYDETELNGTLFYFDMRYILNCSGEEKGSTNLPKSTATTSPTTNVKSTIEKVEDNLRTKVTSSPVISPIVTPSTFKPAPKKYVPTEKVILELAVDETTTATLKQRGIHKDEFFNEISTEDKTPKQKYVKENVYTTSRLATVSAKPLEQKPYDDRDMASDEAKPDRLKAHRSIQEEVKDPNKLNNNAYKHNCHVALFITFLISLRHFLQ